MSVITRVSQDLCLGLADVSRSTQLLQGALFASAGCRDRAVRWDRKRGERLLLQLFLIDVLVGEPQILFFFFFVFLRFACEGCQVSPIGAQSYAAQAIFLR